MVSFISLWVLCVNFYCARDPTPIRNKSLHMYFCVFVYVCVCVFGRYYRMNYYKSLLFGCFSSCTIRQTIIQDDEGRTLVLDAPKQFNSPAKRSNYACKCGEINQISRSSTYRLKHFRPTFLRFRQFRRVRRSMVNCWRNPC
jgi:hypothetical protein